MNIYRVKLVKGDKQFEVEGDKKFVLEMIKKYWLNEPENISTSTTAAYQKKKEQQLSSLQKSQSVGEFIRLLEFKKHTEFVLAFGYYLEKKSDMKDFAAADINKCYYEAKMESSNTSQMLVQNIKSGRIMISKRPTGKLGKYYTLTQTGIDYIEKKMQKKNA